MSIALPPPTARIPSTSGGTEIRSDGHLAPARGRPGSRARPSAAPATSSGRSTPTSSRTPGSSSRPQRTITPRAAPARTRRTPARRSSRRGPTRGRCRCRARGRARGRAPRRASRPRARSRPRCREMNATPKPPCTALRTDSCSPSSSGTSRSRSRFPLLRSSSSTIWRTPAPCCIRISGPSCELVEPDRRGRRTDARAGTRGSPRRGRTARTRRSGGGGRRRRSRARAGGRRRARPPTACRRPTARRVARGCARWNSQSRSGSTIAAGPGRGADLERAAQRRVGLGELLEQLLLEREHPLGAAVESQPGLGRLDPAAGAVEQLRPEPLLERAHLLGDGRLGDARAAPPPPRSCAARPPRRTRPAGACP